MSESERAEKLKAIQLELLQLKREYLLREREIRARLRLIQGMGQKRCRKCDDVMDVDQFYVDVRYLDGRYPYCMECKNAMNKARTRRKGNVLAGRAA